MLDQRACPNPFDTSEIDPLDAEVLESFRRASHLNRHMFARIVEDEMPGVPGRAAMLLALGGMSDGMTQRSIAEALHISAPTVTVMVQKMEADGIIERWTDEADQRVTRIRMTQKGRDISARIFERYRQFVDATIGRMSEADRREFARMLGEFADAMTAALCDSESQQP